MLIRKIYFLPKILMRDWKKREEIERISLKMLKSLLQDVCRINPFYKKKFKDTDITHVKTLDDLRILPFTTKDEMREAFPQNLSMGYTVHNCIHESTSGSTGDVLNIYHDKRAYDYYDAISLRAHRGHSLKITDKIAYTRFEPVKKELFEHWGFFRRLYIPVYYPAQEQLALLLKYDADVISAYPSCLYEIAQLVREHRISITPKFIVSHSELLTAPMKTYLESVFNCPIYRDYSSFEVHNIANECTHGGMHLHVDNNIVEIIKDGAPAAPGEPGEIVVTNLSNRAMPFIRYRIGDIGALEEDTCTCGRGLPLLKMVEGRKDQFLIFPSGREVSPRIFDPLDVIFHKNVSKFQIVQKEKGTFIIKIVKRKDCSDTIADALIEKARTCVPEPVEIHVVEVGDIERTGRGKLRAVICEVNDEQTG